MLKMSCYPILCWSDLKLLIILKAAHGDAAKLYTLHTSSNLLYLGSPDKGPWGPLHDKTGGRGGAGRGLLA